MLCSGSTNCPRRIWESMAQVLSDDKNLSVAHFKGYIESDKLDLKELNTLVEEEIVKPKKSSRKKKNSFDSV